MKKKPKPKRQGGSLDLVQQLRLAGGSGYFSPSDCWYNALRSIGWQLDDDVDEPERFQPAFRTRSQRLNASVPVVVEPYHYLPGDSDDPLARQAFAELPDLLGDPVLVLFRGVPFQEVEGVAYTYAGSIFLKGAWHEVAINERISSVDGLIEQAEAGFRFGTNAPQFGDTRARFARSIAAMSFSLDGSMKGELMSMKTGGWHSFVG
jgi:hypothetical protein